MTVLYNSAGQLSQSRTISSTTGNENKRSEKKNFHRANLWHPPEIYWSSVPGSRNCTCICGKVWLFARINIQLGFTHFCQMGVMSLFMHIPVNLYLYLHPVLDYLSILTFDVIELAPKNYTPLESCWHVHLLGIISAPIALTFEEWAKTVFHLCCNSKAAVIGHFPRARNFSLASLWKLELQGNMYLYSCTSPALLWHIIYESFPMYLKEMHFYTSIIL